RLWLGGEGDSIAVHVKKEWLLSQPIPGHEQRPFRPIPDGERKHAVEMLERVDAEGPVGGQDDLGIALRTKPMAPRLQIDPKLPSPSGPRWARRSLIPRIKARSTGALDRKLNRPAIPHMDVPPRAFPSLTAHRYPHTVAPSRPSGIARLRGDAQQLRSWPHRR